MRMHACGDEKERSTCAVGGQQGLVMSRDAGGGGEGGAASG